MGKSKPSSNFLQSYSTHTPPYSANRQSFGDLACNRSYRLIEILVTSTLLYGFLDDRTLFDLNAPLCEVQPVTKLVQVSFSSKEYELRLVLVSNKAPRDSMLKLVWVRVAVHMA